MTTQDKISSKSNQFNLVNQRRSKMTVKETRDKILAFESHRFNDKIGIRAKVMIECLKFYRTDLIIFVHKIFGVIPGTNPLLKFLQNCTLEPGLHLQLT